MEVHKLLLRQLNRLQFKYDELPQDLNKWQEFLTRINKSYHEADNDRYLIERSMDISSREMQMLNEKLEQAQHIAKMGYWYYDHHHNYSVWSKELYKIIKPDSEHASPNYEDFLALVHPTQRAYLHQLMKRALEKKANFECEVKIKNDKGNFHWYRMICHAQDESGVLAGILIDINKDKEAEEKIQALNKQFVQTARRAGMSEVATSILHNIGNILNSSNLSVHILKEIVTQSYMTKLIQIIEMLEINKEKLCDFLTHDSKGKLIPDYLSALVNIIKENQTKSYTEVQNLEKDLQHIKDIVDVQSTFSGVPGLTEKIFLPELLDTALQLTLNLSRDTLIHIEKDKLQPVFVFCDKSKLLQILVNLIQNAKDAVGENKKNAHKLIQFSTIQDGKDLSIAIQDNGIGIDPSHLEKIFSFGFTTKKKGHGFGLHSSALSAKEMGGSLIAKSTGIGKGALFVLTLPYQETNQNKRVFNG